MFEAEAIEFPFVQEMPKREKTRITKVWEQFRELSRIAEKKGMLVPQNFVAKLLGVSPQRIDQLAQEERLERVYVNGAAFITENSVVEFAATERKNGRPCKMVGLEVSEDVTKFQMAKAALKFGKECGSPKRKE